MATWTWTTSHFKKYPHGKSRGGTMASVAQGFEAATQTYGVHDLLAKSGGKLQLAAAAGSNVTSASGLCGVATQPASGTTNTRREYQQFDKGRLFELPCYSGAAGAATAYTMVGSDYQVRNDATAGPVVDTAQTANPVFHVVDIVVTDGYAVGDVGGLLLGYWIEGALED